ncbi:MAG: hypothetical protein NVS1B14_06530 [Vulcanimicrobiaceae bacterium]
MSFAGRPFALWVLALFLVGAAPAPPLHAFVQRMRAASGEPFRYHLVSTSRERSNGVELTTRSETLGLQFLTRVCEAILCTGTYFDGNRLFGVNVNDTALPASSGSERMLRALRIANSGEFLSSDFEAAGGTLTDLGSAQFADKPARALGIDAPFAQPLVVYVDPATYLLRGGRDTENGTWFEDRDYRSVGPLTLPFTIYQNGILAQQYETRTIASTPFEPPRGLTPHFASTAPWIPMAVTTDAPVSPCTIARIATHCLIDTGNSGASLSLELAEQLHLAPVGEFEVHGLGRYATEVVNAGPLIVGAAEFAAANYVVLHDIHHYGYDAVLGADMFAHAIVTIDYAKHLAAFTASVPERATSTLPLQFLNFVPVVPVELGQTPALLAVDTGDESTINLSYDYYLRHPNLFAATHVRNVSGVGGQSEQIVGEIARVRLGEYRVEAQQIGTTRTLQSTGEGHLGAGFLSHFRVVLDYAHGHLGLTPREGDKAVRMPGRP